MMFSAFSQRPWRLPGAWVCVSGLTRAVWTPPRAPAAVCQAHTWANGPLPWARLPCAVGLCNNQMWVPSPLFPQVKPLIWIESVIEKHSHSRIEYMIKVGVRAVDRVRLGNGIVLPGECVSGLRAFGTEFLHGWGRRGAQCLPSWECGLWLSSSLPHCELRFGVSPRHREKTQPRYWTWPSWQ